MERVRLTIEWESKSFPCRKRTREPTVVTVPVEKSRMKLKERNKEKRKKKIIYFMLFR